MNKTTETDTTRWGLAMRREWLSAVCNATGFDGKRAPAAARDVAAQMALALNNDGEAWVSVDTLADRAGRGQRQTASGRSWLLDNGFLTAAGYRGRARKVVATTPDPCGIPQGAPEPADDVPCGSSHPHLRDSALTPADPRTDPCGIPQTKYLEAPEGVLPEVLEENGGGPESARVEADASPAPRVEHSEDCRSGFDPFCPAEGHGDQSDF
jgi:hypothetical protein